MANDPKNRHRALRLIGRVFSFDGRMHFVLSVDEDGRFARVSCHKSNVTRIIDMPVSEVALRVSGYLDQ